MIWKVVISLLSNHIFELMYKTVWVRIWFGKLLYHCWVFLLLMELKFIILLIICAFNALMLSVGCHEGHPVGKNWVVRYQRGYLISIWSSWCHCHPTVSCSSKIQNGLPFWCLLTQVVLEKRPLSGRSVVVVVRWLFVLTFGSGNNNNNNPFNGHVSRSTWVIRYQ